MVQFNPSSQNEQQSGYLGSLEYYHDPGAIKANEAGKYKGAALSAVPEVGSALTEMKKQSVEQDLYNKASSYQDKLLDDLNSDYQKLAAGDAKLVPPGGSDQRTSDLSDIVPPSQRGQAAGQANMGYGAGQPTPDQLRPIARGAETIEGAKASGKISETQYWMYLHQLAKEARGNNPGWRQAIDDTINKIGGHTIANKAIGSLFQDINSFVTAQKDFANQYNAKLDDPKMRAALQLTGPDDYAYFRSIGLYGTPEQKKAAWAKMDIMAQPIIAQDEINKMENTALANAKQKREFTQKDDLDYFNRQTANTSAQFTLNTITKGEPVTQENINKFLAEVGQNPEAALKLGDSIDSAIALREAQLWEIASRDTPDGRKLSASPADVKASIENQLQGLKDFRDSLVGKNYDHAAFNTKLEEIRAKAAQLQFMKDVPWAQSIKGLKDTGVINTVAGGQFANDFVKRKVGDLNSLETSIPILGSLLGSTKASGNTPPPPDLAKTLSALHATGADAVELQKGIQETHDALISPKITPAAVEAFLTRANSPQFIAGLNLIEKGYTDPKTRLWVKGSSDAAVSFFGDPRAHENVYKNSGPEGYQRFQDAAVNALNGSVWRDAASDLKEVTAGGRQPWWHITYNTDTGHLILQRNPEQETFGQGEDPYVSQGVHEAQIEKAQNAIKIFNQGMQIAKLFGEHHNIAGSEALWAAEFMHDQGFDMNTDSVGFVGNMAESVAKVFAHAAESSGGVEEEESTDPEEAAKEKGIKGLYMGGGS